MMLKIYTASCLFLIGFFAFFSLPIDDLPIPRPVLSVTIGAAIFAGVALYIRSIHRREGFELGWFLVNRYGFLWLAVGLFGILLAIGGALFLFAPFTIEPAFEKGVWPVAGFLVVLFWLSILYFFGFISVSVTGRNTALFRTRQIRRGLLNAVLSFAMAGLAAGLFWASLGVIHDNLVLLSDQTYSLLSWTFFGILLAVGVVVGIIKDPSELLEEKKLDPEL